VGVLEPKWAEHAASWRDPVAVVAGSEKTAAVDRGLLRSRIRGPFWEILHERELTLIVTREYEHLATGLATHGGRPWPTHLPLPHPSGVAYDADRRVLYVAATRNPNQVLTMAPVAAVRERSDVPGEVPAGHPLMALRTWFLPGCLYLHDLALVGGALHANAVGENAVVRFDEGGRARRAWWPRAIEGDAGPDFTRNYLQLNSIAAGPDLARSFFSASTDRIGHRRPGHRNLAVDGRGVIIGGATREPVVRGLTRPHSARLHRGDVWVANSGYGELGVCRDGRYEPVARLAGWTRGLCLAGDLAFVGTSRVIPRFRRYAPGLEIDRSECGVHVVDLIRGEVVASVVWAKGNQIFAVEAVPSSVTDGFVHPSTGRSSARDVARLYYTFALSEATASE
jgi:uncharacterized protein (TIGR03032 family)